MSRFAKRIQQIGKQAGPILPPCRQFVQLRERGLDFTGENGLAQLRIWLSAASPNIESTSGSRFCSPQKADELIQRGFGVAHPAVRARGQWRKAPPRYLHLLLFWQSARGAW